MSIAWFPNFPQQPARPPRGAAPVGQLADLPMLEQGAVYLLRQWCSDEAGRIAIAHDFTRSLGDEQGVAAVNGLAHLIGLMVGHGRRPFMRHDQNCTCLGGDESAFAQMVAAASAGDTEDAMAFALTMMPAAIAYEAVQTAESLGLFIHALALNLRGQSPYPFPKHRH
jgi:hypothetical protein